MFVRRGSNPRSGPFVGQLGNDMLNLDPQTSSHDNIYAPGRQIMFEDPVSRRNVMMYHYVPRNAFRGPAYFGINYVDFSSGCPYVVAWAGTPGSRQAACMFDVARKLLGVLDRHVTGKEGLSLLMIAKQNIACTYVALHNQRQRNTLTPRRATREQPSDCQVYPTHRHSPDRITKAARWRSCNAGAVPKLG